VSGRSVPRGPGAAPGASTAPAQTARVAEHLLAGILSGAYAPGAHLPEVQVARSLGSSRTPVRMALEMLRGSGHVDFVPRRGFRVRAYGEGEVAEAVARYADIERAAALSVAAAVGAAEAARLVRAAVPAPARRTIGYGLRAARRPPAEREARHMGALAAASGSVWLGALMDRLLPAVLQGGEGELLAHRRDLLALLEGGGTAGGPANGDARLGRRGHPPAGRGGDRGAAGGGPARLGDPVAGAGGPGRRRGPSAARAGVPAGRE